MRLYVFKCELALALCKIELCLGFEGKCLHLQASAKQGRLAGTHVGKWTTAFVEIFQTKSS